jgi:hypothetical protein
MVFLKFIKAYFIEILVIIIFQDFLDDYTGSIFIEDALLITEKCLFLGGQLVFDRDSAGS